MGVALVFMSVARAQGEEDALRISSIRPGGTARSNGLANAFGAVGADPVSVAINPAGMALYRAVSDHSGLRGDTPRSKRVVRSFSRVIVGFMFSLPLPERGRTFPCNTFGILPER